MCICVCVGLCVCRHGYTRCIDVCAKVRHSVHARMCIGLPYRCAINSVLMYCVAAQDLTITVSLDKGRDYCAMTFQDQKPDLNHFLV